MSNEQESPLEFPVDFPVKAMGRAGEDFDATVVELVRRHAPGLHEDAVRVRASEGGRYISVTVTVRAESREQLDNIYRELTAHEQVLMAL